MYIICAVARVACPHKSISTLGVNHLRKNLSLSFIKKAVSDKLFSRAIDCITSSGNQSTKGQTAAGFPENNLLVNASTL